MSNFLLINLTLDEKDKFLEENHKLTSWRKIKQKTGKALYLWKKSNSLTKTFLQKILCSVDFTSEFYKT